LGRVPAASDLADCALCCSDPKAFARRCRKAGLKVQGSVVTLPAALGGTWLLQA